MPHSRVKRTCNACSDGSGRCRPRTLQARLRKAHQAQAKPRSSPSTPTRTPMFAATESPPRAAAAPLLKNGSGLADMAQEI